MLPRGTSPLLKTKKKISIHFSWFCFSVSFLSRQTIHPVCSQSKPLGLNSSSNSHPYFQGWQVCFKQVTVNAFVCSRAFSLGFHLCIQDFRGQCQWNGNSCNTSGVTSGVLPGRLLPTTILYVSIWNASWLTVFCLLLPLMETLNSEAKRS